MSNISKSANIKGLSVTNLKLFRQFYKVYPEIAQAVIDFFEKNNLIQLASGQLSIGQSLSDQSETPIGQSLSDELQYVVTKAIGAGNTHKLGLKPNKLITNLSFSHIVELIKIEDTHKRAFYELECAKGVWSVRELKRQIESLYLERSGLSKDQEKLFEFRVLFFLF